MPLSVKTDFPSTLQLHILFFVQLDPGIFFLENTYLWPMIETALRLYLKGNAIFGFFLICFLICFWSLSFSFFLWVHALQWLFRFELTESWLKVSCLAVFLSIMILFHCITNCMTLYHKCMYHETKCSLC